MMRVAKTQLWVCPAAHFVSEHECADPCHVALESQHLQIQHQPGIIRKLFGHSNRFLHARQFFRGLLLRHLDLPLNTTHSIGISKPISKDGSWVCLPSSLAAIWSTETPQ